MNNIKSKHICFLKKYMFAVIGAGLILATFSASPLMAQCPTGLDAYWQMEEDSTGQPFSGYLNEVGDGNIGLCSGSCPTLDTMGMVNSGQRFNGSDAGIAVAASTIFDFGGSDDFSIELWFKRQSITGREVLVGRYANPGIMNWWLGIENGRVAFSLTSTNGMSGYIVSQKSVANDVWHHVVAVRTNGENRLYLDGQMEDSDTVSYSYGFESTEPVTIGYLDDDVPAYHFGGTMDEVAIYNVALAEQEIQMRYFLSRGYCETHHTPAAIMPLGDSITLDNYTGDPRTDGDKTGYRFPLWTWLNNASYWVDFIGSKKAGENYFSDPDNAGFKGINAAELWELLDTGYDSRNDNQESNGPYLETYPCDVILLHIGTNDVTTSTTAVEYILDEIDEYDPKITVILARIINRAIGALDRGTTSTFNNNIEPMAQARILNGDKIIIVDMEDGADIDYRKEPAGDMQDDLHPSTDVFTPGTIDSGYDKMADAWYSNLENFLPQSSPPEITSSPVTSVNAGQVYIYDVKADGRPLLFSLTEGPGGMVIDETKGRIEWTPSLSGTVFNVSVEVSNWLDTATQSFSVSVNGPPVFTGSIPDQSIPANASFETISLDNYLNDPDNTASEISWSYSGNSDLIVDISGNVATINAPAANWSGSETITFRATDPGGLFDEDTAIFAMAQGTAPPEPNVPGQSISPGENFNPINLDSHVSDPDNSTAEMSWSVSGNNELVVTISGSRVAEITAPANWTGSEVITFRATDPSGSYGESSATFSVKQSSGGGGGGCFIGSMLLEQ